MLSLLLACNTQEVGPHEGRQAPDIHATSLEGALWDLESVEGRPVVVVFWASWCGPCRKEAPEIKSLTEHYGDRISVVGVNVGETPAVARHAALAWGLTWPVLVDTEGTISRAYEVSAVPLVVVVDAHGLVRYRGNGLPSDVHRLVDGLMG